MSDKKGGKEDHDKEKSKPTGGGDGTDKAKGVVGSMLENLLRPLQSVLPKQNLNILISLLNPWLDDSAEVMAGKVKGWLGAHPWLHDKKVGAALGAVAAKIEDEADKYDEPTKVALKKASDWFETFASELRKDSGDGNTHGKVVKPDSELGKAFDADKARFAKTAAERVETALPSELAMIREHNRMQAEALAESQRDIAHGIPQPERPKEPRIPISERLHQVGEVMEGALKPIHEELETGLAEFKAKTARQQAEQQAEREAQPPTLPRKLRRLFFGI